LKNFPNNTRLYAPYTMHHIFLSGIEAHISVKRSWLRLKRMRHYHQCRLQREGLGNL